MANSYIQLPPDGTGKKADTFLHTVDGQGVHAQRIDFFQPAGCIVAITNSTLVVNKHHIVLWNDAGSGKIIRIPKILVLPHVLAAITGKSATFSLKRISAPGTGTGIVKRYLDTQDPDPSALIKAYASFTVNPTVIADSDLAETTLNPEETVTVPAPLPLFEIIPGIKPVTIREGQGITIQQDNYGDAGTISVYIYFYCD